MTDDKRNFRSYYYEKVGFLGVEEKKSIEILLSESPIDMDKLSQFCLRFPVPSMYRAVVWKVMLGVLPPHRDLHAFVLQQRQEQYEDLLNALRVSRRIIDETPKSEIFLKMFLLEQGKLKLRDETQFLEKQSQDFLAITLAFGKMFTSDTEVYWLSQRFVKSLTKIKENYNLLYDHFILSLLKEDPELYAHLTRIDAIQSLPTETWFNRCFAGTLHEKQLEKYQLIYWQSLQVCAVLGATNSHTNPRCVSQCEVDDKTTYFTHLMLFLKIPAYVGVAVLTTCRHTLQGYMTSHEVNQYISWLTEDASEVIANQAIETWKKHGDLGRIKT